MITFLLIGFVIGGIVGAGIMYSLQNQALAKKEEEIAEVKQKLKEVEANQESLLEEKIDALKAEHRQELSERITAIKNEYESRIQELEALNEQKTVLASPPMESQGTEDETTKVDTLEVSDPPVVTDVMTEVDTPAIDDTSAEDTTLAETTSEQVPSESVPPQTQRMPVEILAEKVTAIAESGEISDIPFLLDQVSNSQAQIRCLAATGLGKIVQGKPVRREVQGVITTLGKLCRDPEPKVRQAAIAALSKISSVKTLPWLKVALRDSNSEVVKSASEALGNFKFYPGNSQTKKVKKAKNARV